MPYAKLELKQKQKLPLAWQWEKVTVHLDFSALIKNESNNTHTFTQNYESFLPRDVSWEKYKRVYISRKKTDPKHTE